MPKPPFVPQTVISSADVNTDFSDIATALTDSLAADGQTPMTGPILGESGSAGSPSYTYNAEVTSGWYHAGLNDIRLSIGGTDVFQITGSGASIPDSVEFFGVPFNTTSPVPIGSEFAFSGLIAPTGWVLEFGQTVPRGTTGDTYNALFNVITTTVTGTPTNGSPTINSVGTNLQGTGIEGAFIEGTGIPTNTTIISVLPTSITMSQNATGGSAGETLRILPFGQGDGSTTFNIPDRRGRVLAGRDNMGGAAAGLLTGQTNGINGIELNAVGGEETHTLTTPQIPSHVHVNTLTDLGHIHIANIPSAAFAGSAGGSGAVTIQVGGVGIGVVVNTNTTGITINNAAAGGGGGHNNVQPTGITNYIIKL